MTDGELRKQLEAELSDAPWADLAPHYERGALIVVAPTVGLVEAGVAVARDRKEEVAAWLAGGQLTKAGPAHAERWAKESALKLRFLIIKPFVLVQERPSAFH